MCLRIDTCIVRQSIAILSILRLIVTPLVEIQLEERMKKKLLSGISEFQLHQLISNEKTPHISKLK